MSTLERSRRTPHLAASQADELLYAIALAMLRRQMRRKWPRSVRGDPANGRQPGGFDPENLTGVAPVTGPMVAVSLT